MFNLKYLPPTTKRRRRDSSAPAFSSIPSCQRSVFIGLTTLLAVVVVASGAPVSSTSQAEIYLSQYGYLPASARNPTSGGLLDANTWNKAIQDFQAFAGLNTTGDLDNETLHLMSMPRCGVRDKVGLGNERSKRYALQGSRWKVKNLTYRISKYPRRLSKRDVDEEIAKAFNVWSDFTNLTFSVKPTGGVHIEIRFVNGEHGDGDPFDGAGGTLAHAFFPVYGGDAHFDDDEYWTIGSSRGTNLFQVAAHEFGHSLGLSHSDNRAALMAPFYRGFLPGFSLNDDDIQAIQALYGQKDKATTQRPQLKPPTAPRDDTLCENPKIDAIFNSAEGDTYVFKGKHYYLLTKDAIAVGYPKKISEGWPGLPGDIDAAFTYKNGKTYFFKGENYWRYQGRNMDGAYPKAIRDGFTGIPDTLDAAMVWGGNGKIYFFKGSKFWRFDPLNKPPVKATYPKPIKNWAGVPDSIDGAFQYTNGYTYFFKGDKYYRFNDRAFKVDTASPAFPRPISTWWFGCRNYPATRKGNIKENSEELELDSSSPFTSDDDDNGDVLYDADADDHQADDETLEANKSSRSESGASSRHTISIGGGILLALLSLVTRFNFSFS